MDLTVVVGTYGDGWWVDLARERALPSARQFGVPVIHEHGSTLAEARNAGAAAAATEWLVFLDADDELRPDYLTRMAEGSADVRVPSVEYVVHGRTRPPAMPRVVGHDHDCGGDCLLDGNWIVIGAAVRRQLVVDVGGFREWPMYEDFCLWLRCHLAGATFESIPRAVYRAHRRSGSRNRAHPMDVRNRVHHEIVAAAYNEWAGRCVNSPGPGRTLDERAPT